MIDDRDPRLIAAIRATRAGGGSALWQIASGRGGESDQVQIAARAELCAIVIEAVAGLADGAAWDSGSAGQADIRELGGVRRRLAGADEAELQHGDELCEAAGVNPRTLRLITEDEGGNES